MFEKEELDRLKKFKKNWQVSVKQILKRRPERKHFELDSGRPVEPVYDPTDLENYDYLVQQGLPGSYPFTRGIHSTMYRSRLWTMRQYAGFGTAEDTNRRFRYLLDQGQTGLSVAFDLPTQIGYDSDHALARSEVGKVGVAIDSLADMEILLEQIPLDRVSTSMTINAPAAVLLAMYMAAAEKRGVSWDKLRGTIQNDILKEYVARGTYIFPPRESMRLVVDIFDYAVKHLPLWNTISVSGYHFREAGSTAVQELAFTFSNAIAYVEAAREAGLAVDAFARRFTFFFNAHVNFFEEIAKFRAARRIWARLMKERFGARDPRSMKLRFHTQTAGCSLTAQQPDVNIVRVTLQALSAVLGGTQSLHTNSRDEALALPSEYAATLALRTQQVIGYETGVTDTVDPLGGSYYIESLTDQIEKDVNSYIKRIDELGGAIAAIEKGFMQQEIQESAYHFQCELETGRRVMVGVNQFNLDDEQSVELLKVDPAVAERQINRLAAVRGQRSQQQVSETLQRLRKAAQGSENVMPFILEAVKAYATIGEICGVLREVFGEYRQQIV